MKEVKLEDVSLLLRPKNFSEYVGQAKLKERLSLFISAAEARKEPLDHILLYGPPGLGKTTIAKVIAEKLKANLRITSGPVLEKVGDIASILMSMKDNDFLFIDEIHSLNKLVEEMLYPAMEDKSIDVIIGKGPTSKSVRFKLKNFTIIGATTKVSMLSSPLRDRFGFVHRLEFYSLEELASIVVRSAKILGVSIESDAAIALANSSRGTPRIANNLLKRIRDFAEVSNKNNISVEVVRNVLKMMEIDFLGLDQMDRNILKALIDRYSGTAVGLGTLSYAIGEDKKVIEDVHEPFLIKSGLIERTKKGRVVTEKGLRHIKEYESI